MKNNEVKTTPAAVHNRVLIVLSPTLDSLGIRQSLTNLGESVTVHIIEHATTLREIPELFDRETTKILAIDPDFSGWNVENDLIDDIPRLEAICLQTTSFGWIDTEYCRSKGIAVTNLRGFSTEAVAEWALFASLALARKAPEIIRARTKGEIAHPRGIEMRGRTAGIIGLGRIGTRVAELCNGIGMQVQYWSKHTRDTRFTYVDLRQLLSTSDFLYVCVADCPETRGLINESMLTGIKPAACIINVTFQDIIDHRKALGLVQDGILLGYGYEDDRASLLDQHANIWASPEIAWCTEESYLENGKLWVASMQNAIVRKYPTLVN